MNQRPMTAAGAVQALRRSWPYIVCLSLLLPFLALPAAAQQNCELRRFGGPNRFYPTTVNSLAELQTMFRTRRADIESVLRQAGWDGDADDVFNAVEQNEGVRSRTYPPGQDLRWMALRRNGQPTVVRDKCWGGSAPFDAFEIIVDSNDNRWHFAVPKTCGNLALISWTEIPASERIRPEPVATPTPAPTPRPTPQPTPEPPRQAAPPEPPEPAPMKEPVFKLSDRWVVRVFGALSSADDEQHRVINLSPTQQIRDDLDVGSGWGLGASVEYLFNDNWGIEGGVMYLQNETNYKRDLNNDVWDMDSDDIVTMTWTVGANYHITPDRTFDLFAGPFLGFATFNDVNYTILGAPVESDFDSEFLWGAQVGVDVPVCGSQCWMFTASLKYIDLGVEGGLVFDNPGVEEFDLDLNPIVFTFGGAYRF